MTQPTRQQLRETPPSSMAGVIPWLVRNFGPWVVPTLIMCFTSWTLWVKYDESNCSVKELLVANINAANAASTSS